MTTMFLIWAAVCAPLLLFIPIVRVVASVAGLFALVILGWFGPTTLELFFGVHP